MTMEIPYAYITAYIFETLVYLEGKRNIKISTLIDCINNLIEFILDDYYENEDHYLMECDHLDGVVKFKEVDKNECLLILAKHCSDFFYIKDEELFVHNTVSLRQLRDLKREKEILPTRFGNALQRKEIYDMIGIKRIYDFQKHLTLNFHKLEQEIENDYTIKENKSTKELLYKRLLWLLNATANNKLFFDEYCNIPQEDDFVVDEKYDYFNESRYTKNKEPYPIDNELYVDSEYYENMIEAFNPIQQNIEDMYHYAIFGSGPLYDDKYREILCSVYMFGLCKIDESKFPGFKPQVEKVEDEEIAFYVVYINKLNELIDNGHIELVNKRNRLLYALDDFKFCMYDKENFEKIYNESLNFEIDEDSFKNYGWEAAYYITDIFEGNSGSKIEKAIFISTYYELTKNPEIKDIFEQYEEHESYELYKQIIFGKKKGYSKRLNKK